MLSPAYSSCTDQLRNLNQISSQSELNEWREFKAEKKGEQNTGFNGAVVWLLHRGGNLLDDDSADGVPAGVRISPWFTMTVADVELDLHSTTTDASAVAFHSRNAVDVVVFSMEDEAIDSSRDCALGAIESEEPALAAAATIGDAQISVISDAEVGARTQFVKRAFLSEGGRNERLANVSFHFIYCVCHSIVKEVNG